MDLAPAPPRIYPYPCTHCRGRFRCHCAILEACGRCSTCYTYQCKCVKIRYKCNECQSPYECVCDIRLYYASFVDDTKIEKTS